MSISFLMKLLGMPESLEDLEMKHVVGLLNGDYDYLFILRDMIKPPTKILLSKVVRVEAEFVEEVPNPHRVLPEHVGLSTYDKIISAHINIVPKKLILSPENQKRYDKACSELAIIEHRLTLEHIKRLHQRALPSLIDNSD